LLDDNEAVMGHAKLRANANADAKKLAAVEEGSTMVPAIEDGAWSWSKALESIASWLATRLTRNVLDLALSSEKKPKSKQSSQRKKRALC